MRPLLSLTAAALCLSAAVSAAPAKKPLKKPAMKTPATLGTHQMAGGEGVFGTTYSLTDGGGYGPFNWTLVSAEYRVDRVNFGGSNTVVPKADEKLLVIRYRVKNPNKTDFYYSSRDLFQTVADDGQTRDDVGSSRRESQKEGIAMSLKPGQGFDDLMTCAVVPAKGGVPKLILKFGRVGTPEQVVRYALGQGKNLVQPIPAPYADPADPSGATARTEIPAQVGTTYTAGFYDLRLDSMAAAPGPLGELAADEGKQFFIATVTLTNRAWEKNYCNDTVAVTLLTADGDKITEYTKLKPTTDQSWEGRQVDPGESTTLRLALAIPKDAKLTTLKLAENVDNSGGLSRAFVYDASSVK